MLETVNHILSREGILTTFSIDKRVSAEYVKRLQQKIKSDKISEEKFQKLLYKAVLEETQKALLSQKVPGLILPGHNIPEKERKKMMELTHFASMIAKKLGEKNADKFYSCYIINAIVNMLGLTESDFDEFHRKFSKYRDGNQEGEDPESSLD